MHGEGHYIWGDGREYIGSYKNDKKHGFGKYRWADKRKYIGFWENGKQNGYGKYIMANGCTQYGIWGKGKRTRWLSEEELKNLAQNSDFKTIIETSPESF